MKKLKPKRSPEYNLQINFHVTGTLSEKRDDRTFNLNESRHSKEMFDFNITFNNNANRMHAQSHKDRLSGLNRAAKLNSELQALLFKEEHS